jgi:hypothetical protein
MAFAWIVHEFDNGEAYVIPLHRGDDGTVPLEVIEAD